MVLPIFGRKHDLKARPATHIGLRMTFKIRLNFEKSLLLFVDRRFPASLRANEITSFEILPYPKTVTLIALYCPLLSLTVPCCPLLPLLATDSSLLRQRPLSDIPMHPPVIGQ